MVKLSFVFLLSAAICGPANAAMDTANLRGLASDEHSLSKPRSKKPSSKPHSKTNSLGGCGSCKANPCTEETIEAGYYYHEHCRRNNKFLQCGPVAGMCYEMDCATGTVWDQEKLTCVHSKPKSKSKSQSKSHSKSNSKTSDMKSCGSCRENPCTEKAIEAGEFYHEHCNRSKKFLQCGPVAGMCYEMDCAPGTVWDQKKLTCVHSKPHHSRELESPPEPRPQPPYESDMGPCGSCEENPCTEEAIEEGKFYHKHCNQRKKFLQCGHQAGMCYERKCAPGTVWRQSKQTCVAKRN